MANSKNVLLICPKYFGYELEIKKTLENKKYDVDYISDRPFTNNFLKAFSRLFPAITNFLFQSRFQHKFNSLLEKDYAIVLVILGGGLTPKLISNLKSNHINAKFIFYSWDSFKNTKNMLNIYRYFDVKASFDPNDCEQYGLHYRPLFYVEGYDESEHKPAPVYNISFAGTAHSDRVSIVHQIKSNLMLGENYFFLYLQAKWVFLIYKIFNKSYKNSSIKDIDFIPKSKKDLQVIFSKSKAILDIEHPNQVGFTMRTFETLAAGKKLITTNHNILKADFYDDRNILLIDRFKPIIPNTFLSSDYVQIDQKLLKKYSIDGWLSDILSFSKNVN